MKKLLTALICAAMMMCAFGCADSTYYSTDYSTRYSACSAGTSAGDGSAAEQTDAATEGGELIAYLTGYFVETQTTAGTRYFIALSDNDIIVLHGKNVGLDELQTGDYIKIKIEGIAESYPPQTTVQELELLSSGGGYDSVPEESVEKLEDLGYTIILPDSEQSDAAAADGDSTADAEDYSYFTGHVIETCVSADSAYTDNVFFIALSEKSWYDENTIIMMKEKDVDFGGLKTGDCIKIKVLTVEESYPLQAAVYDFELLSSDGYDSVPLESISEVESCGYTVKSATE